MCDINFGSLTEDELAKLSEYETIKKQYDEYACKLKELETINDKIITRKKHYERFMSKVDKRGLVRSDMSPCWRWIGGTLSSAGYGQISIDNEFWNAHRYSYYIHNGYVEIEKGKHICHKCDNKECSNPDHLYLGTPKDNAKDVWDRGLKTKKPPKEKKVNIEPCYECVKHHKKCVKTGDKCQYCIDNNLECVIKEHKPTTGCFTSESAAGENNGRAKLTWDDVNKIRERYNAGLKYGQLKKMAAEYEISYIAIQKIVSNKTWIINK